jgi:hypothetical protein
VSQSGFWGTVENSAWPISNLGSSSLAGWPTMGKSPKQDQLGCFVLQTAPTIAILEFSGSVLRPATCLDTIHDYRAGIPL